MSCCCVVRSSAIECGDALLVANKHHVCGATTRETCRLIMTCALMHAHEHQQGPHCPQRVRTHREGVAACRLQERTAPPEISFIIPHCCCPSSISPHLSRRQPQLIRHVPDITHFSSAWNGRCSAPLSSSDICPFFLSTSFIFPQELRASVPLERSSIER